MRDANIALRAATVDRLGGAQHIVEEHLVGAMSELSDEQKAIAARILREGLGGGFLVFSPPSARSSALGGGATSASSHASAGARRTIWR